MKLVFEDPSFEEAKNKLFIEFRPDIQPFCFGCGIYRDSKLQQCKECRVANYCSVECQKKDWSEHKAMCGPLQKGELNHIEVKVSYAQKNMNKMLGREWLLLRDPNADVFYDAPGGVKVSQNDMIYELMNSNDLDS